MLTPVHHCIKLPGGINAVADKSPHHPNRCFCTFCLIWEVVLFKGRQAAFTIICYRKPWGDCDKVPWIQSESREYDFGSVNIPVCLSDVQKRAGGGDEDKNGDRPKDEKVPPLDEEWGTGQADIHRRLTAPSSVCNIYTCLSASIHRQHTPCCVERCLYRMSNYACLYSERYFHSDKASNRRWQSEINCELGLQIFESIFTSSFFFPNQVHLIFNEV